MKKIVLKFVALAFVILFLGQVSESQEICRNLHASSCDHGILDDGTGVAATRPPTGLSDTDPLNAITQAQVRRFFSENRTAFRSQSVAKMNLECELLPNFSTQTQICDSEIETKLFNLVQRRRASGTAGRYELTELVFMEESGFLGLINEVDFGGRLQVNVAEQEEKVTRLFGQVKEALIRKIESTNLSSEHKRIITSRLRQVNNLGSDCGATFGMKDYFLPKAFYDPQTNNFLLCRNLLNQTNSEFALTTVIAHEMSHAIDPCVLRFSNPETFGEFVTNDFYRSEVDFPYSNLTSCLRSPSSIRAVNLEVSQAAPNSGPVRTSFCHNDQIGEASSDWFASEVLVDVIRQNYPNLTQDQWRNGMRNTFRLKCDQSQVDHVDGFEPHAPVEARFNAIILANQSVRERIGCANVNYNKVQCSIDAPRGAVSTNGPSTIERSNSGSGSSSGSIKSNKDAGTSR